MRRKISVILSGVPTFGAAVLLWGGRIMDFIGLPDAANTVNKWVGDADVEIFAVVLALTSVALLTAINWKSIQAYFQKEKAQEPPPPEPGPLLELKPDMEYHLTIFYVVRAMFPNRIDGAGNPETEDKPAAIEITKKLRTGELIAWGLYIGESVERKFKKEDWELRELLFLPDNAQTKAVNRESAHLSQFTALRFNRSQVERYWPSREKPEHNVNSSNTNFTDNSVKSVNQKGGITAHSINVGNTQRRLTKALSEKLLSELDKNKTIDMTIAYGDPEAESYAHEIRSFLKQNGYNFAYESILYETMAGGRGVPYLSLSGEQNHITIGPNVNISDQIKYLGMQTRQ